jgi:hypothetical protein
MWKVGDERSLYFRVYVYYINAPCLTGCVDPHGTVRETSLRMCVYNAAAPPVPTRTGQVPGLRL